MMSSASLSPAGPGRRMPEPGRPLTLSRGRVIDVLRESLRAVDALELTVDVPGVDQARARRTALASQIRDNLLPRLSDADVPAIVVVGGSTGAGKSTLVNSVLGQEVSQAGVLRPTTRVPVLVVNPEDAPALAGHPLSEVCRTVTSPAVPAGLALVDASDLDSVQEANRALASRLLEAADLWLFITTAARYGDLTPWATLEAAAARGTSIAVVLNRAPQRVLAEVRRDLLARLESLGLADAPFFVIPDAGPHEGPLAGAPIEEVAQWLELLAGRHRAAGLMRRADRRVWEAVRADLLVLADAADAQETAAARIEEDSHRCAAAVADRVVTSLEAGDAGQGALATRWVALASTGGPLADVAHSGTLRRGLFGRRERARQAALATLADDACQALDAVVGTAAAEAGDAVARAWREGGAGDAADRAIVRPGQQAAGAGAVDDGAADNGVPAGDEVPAARQAVAQWRARVQAMQHPPVHGLTTTAVGDLLTAAAAGLAGASSAAGRLGLGEAVTQAAAELTAAVRAAVEGLVPTDTARRLGPGDGVAAQLRVRAGELSPLSRPGQGGAQ